MNDDKWTLSATCETNINDTGKKFNKNKIYLDRTSEREYTLNIPSILLLLQLLHIHTLNSGSRVFYVKFSVEMQNRFASTVNEFTLLNKVEHTNAIAADFRATNTDDSYERLISLLVLSAVATSVTHYYYLNFVYFSVLRVIFVKLKLKTWPTFIVWILWKTKTWRRKQKTSATKNSKVWIN